MPEIKPRLALPSRDTATLTTPSEATRLRWRVKNLSETELTSPPPDIAGVLKDMLIFAGLHKEATKTRGVLAGLNATQLGYGYNIWAVDWNNTLPPSQRPADYQPRIRIFANATLGNLSVDEDISTEGCFSVEPGVIGHVVRHKQVAVDGYELNVEKFLETGIAEFTKLKSPEPTPHERVAFAVQHEEAHSRGERFPAEAHLLGKITNLDEFRASGGKRGFEPLDPHYEEKLRTESKPA